MARRFAARRGGGLGAGVPYSLLGAASGVATLNSSGVLTASQRPTDFQWVGKTADETVVGPNDVPQDDDELRLDLAAGIHRLVFDGIVTAASNTMFFQSDLGLSNGAVASSYRVWRLQATPNSGTTAGAVNAVNTPLITGTGANTHAQLIFARITLTTGGRVTWKWAQGKVGGEAGNLTVLTGSMLTALKLS